jgi:hypothetical protein
MMKIIREESVIIQETRENMTFELRLYPRENYEEEDQPRLVLCLQSINHLAKRGGSQMSVFALDRDGARAVAEICTKFAEGKVTGPAPPFPKRR